MEIVTERLLHEEQKIREKGAGGDGRKAFVAKGRQLTCHYCKKP